MMYIFRFLSLEEFNKFINGDVLYNDRIHTGATNSIGFCFFPEDDLLNSLDDIKKDCQFNWQFLEGAIVEPDICCIFEIDENIVKKEHPTNIGEAYLCESHGEYADPYGSFWDRINIVEMCCKWYCKKDFKLVCYCNNFKNNLDLEGDWEWINW